MRETGQLIRKVRRARRWSQARLAEEAGLGEATIRRTEVGRHTPSTQTLEAIARALGVRLSWLLEPHEVADGNAGPAEGAPISPKSPANVSEE